jgi:hypothetical protein
LKELEKLARDDGEKKERAVKGPPSTKSKRNFLTHLSDSGLSQNT